MKDILFEKEDSRIEILRKLFGVDKYKIIRDNTTLISKDFTNKKKLLYSKINESSDCEKKLRENERQKTELASKLSKISAKQKQFQDENLKIEKLEQEKRELNANERIFKQEIVQLERRKKEITAQMNKCENTLANTHAVIKNLKAKLKNSEGISIDIIKKFESDKSLFHDIEKKLQRLQIENENRSKIISDIENELAELTIAKEKEMYEKFGYEIGREKKELRIEEGTIEKEITNIKKTIKFIDTHDKCTQCEQEITDKKGLIEKKEKECEKREEELNDVRRKIADIDKNAKEKHEGKIKEKETELDTIRNEQNRSAEKILELEQQCNSLHDISHKLEKARETYNKKQKLESQIDNEIKNKERYELESSNFKNELNSIINEEQAKLNYIKEQNELNKDNNKETIEELLQRKRTNQNEILIMSKNKGRIENELTNLEEKNKQHKKIIEERENDKKTAERYEKIIDYLNNHFTNLMTLIENNRMININRDFNIIFRRWISALIEDIEVRVDKNFTPIITSKGYEMDIKSLSGGEKTSLALVYRISLNKMINEHTHPSLKTRDIIIFDEPTDGFSTEQLDKVRDLFNNLNLKQIVVISHEEKIETYADTVLRFEKRNGVTEITEGKN